MATPAAPGIKQEGFEQVKTGKKITILDNKLL